MFLSKKLAERERTGQRSRSKQGLSCPGFSLSIPVLNGLSDRSKPVQGFSHAIFHPFFLFSACFACQTRSKTHAKAKLHPFWQKFSRFLSKPVQRRSTTLFFSVKGSAFSCQVSVKSNLSIESDWTVLNGEKRLEWGGDFLRLSSFKCTTSRIIWLQC